MKSFCWKFQRKTKTNKKANKEKPGNAFILSAGNPILKLFFLLILHYFRFNKTFLVVWQLGELFFDLNEMLRYRSMTPLKMQDVFNGKTRDYCDLITGNVRHGIDNL